MTRKNPVFCLRLVRQDATTSTTSQKFKKCTICEGNDGMTKINIYSCLDLDWCRKCQTNLVPKQIKTVRVSIAQIKTITVPTELVDLILETVGWYSKDELIKRIDFEIFPTKNRNISVATHNTE